MRPHRLPGSLKPASRTGLSAALDAEQELPDRRSVTVLIGGGGPPVQGGSLALDSGQPATYALEGTVPGTIAAPGVPVTGTGSSWPDDWPAALEAYPIEADDGTVGWGESITQWPESAKATEVLMERLALLLVGQDALDNQEL